MVSDEDVEKALAYLNADPSPISLAKLDLMNTENEKERVYATILMASKGKSIAAREYEVEASEEYRVACNMHSAASAAYDDERARMRGAEAIIDVWRSQNANIRAAERIR